MLQSAFSPAFDRDIKRLKKKRRNIEKLKVCMRLILENTPAARNELIRRRNMYTLSGAWANAG